MPCMCTVHIVHLYGCYTKIWEIHIGHLYGCYTKIWETPVWAFPEFLASVTPATVHAYQYNLNTHEPSGLAIIRRRLHSERFCG